MNLQKPSFSTPASKAIYVDLRVGSSDHSNAFMGQVRQLTTLINDETIGLRSFQYENIVMACLTGFPDQELELTNVLRAIDDNLPILEFLCARERHAMEFDWPALATACWNAAAAVDVSKKEAALALIGHWAVAYKFGGQFIKLRMLDTLFPLQAPMAERTGGGERGKLVKTNEILKSLLVVAKNSNSAEPNRYYGSLVEIESENSSQIKELGMIVPFGKDYGFWVGSGNDTLSEIASKPPSRSHTSHSVIARIAADDSLSLSSSNSSDSDSDASDDADSIVPIQATQIIKVWFPRLKTEQKIDLRFRKIRVLQEGSDLEAKQILLLTLSLLSLNSESSCLAARVFKDERFPGPQTLNKIVDYSFEHDVARGTNGEFVEHACGIMFVEGNEKLAKELLVRYLIKSGKDAVSNVALKSLLKIPARPPSLMNETFFPFDAFIEFPPPGLLGRSITYANLGGKVVSYNDGKKKCKIHWDEGNEDDEWMSSSKLSYGVKPGKILDVIRENKLDIVKFSCDAILYGLSIENVIHTPNATIRPMLTTTYSSRSNGRPTSGTSIVSSTSSDTSFVTASSDKSTPLLAKKFKVDDEPVSHMSSAGTVVVTPFIVDGGDVAFIRSTASSIQPTPENRASIPVSLQCTPSEGGGRPGPPNFSTPAVASPASIYPVTTIATAQSSSLLSHQASAVAGQQSSSRNQAAVVGGSQFSSIHQISTAARPQSSIPSQVSTVSGPEATSPNQASTVSRMLSSPLPTLAAAPTKPKSSSSGAANRDSGDFIDLTKDAPVDVLFASTPVVHIFSVRKFETEVAMPRTKPQVRPPSVQVPSARPVATGTEGDPIVLLDD